MDYSISDKEPALFTNRLREEFDSIPFEVFKNIGLNIIPEEFDFIYGYPSLNELKSVDTLNPALLKTKENLGLYIHIPFCTKVCSFCYFIKNARSSNEYIKEYIKALQKEIEYYSKLSEKVKISYCYIGGGTPTYLNENYLFEILQSINANFSFSDDFEFTCEASPETLTENKLKLLKENGVTRISLGVQSFNNELTKEMNRAHNQRHSITTIALLSKYFPENFNIDIIYGYPNSTEEILFRDIEICNSLNVPSITLYQIWMKLNSILRKKGNQINCDDIFLQKLIARYFLYSNGYHRDKSDWFIKTGKAKFKFQNHKWENKYYYGIGASAYAYVNDIYYRNETSIDKYLKRVNENKLGIGTALELTSENVIRRACVLGIKINKGINIKYIHDRDKLFSESLEPIFERLSEAGLGKFENNYFRLTELGFLIPDNISELFFSNKSTESFSQQNFY